MSGAAIWSRLPKPPGVLASVSCVQDRNVATFCGARPALLSERVPVPLVDESKLALPSTVERYVRHGDEACAATGGISAFRASLA